MSIGDTSQAESTLWTAAGVLFLQRVQSTVDQTLTSVECWSRCGNASWAEQIYVVYSDNAGAPDALLAQSAAFFTAPDFVMAQRSAALITPLSLTSGSYYWIGTQAEHDSTSVSFGSSSGNSYYTYYDGSFGTIIGDLTGLGSVSADSRFAFSGTTTGYVEDDVIGTLESALDNATSNISASVSASGSISSTLENVRARIRGLSGEDTGGDTVYAIAGRTPKGVSLASSVKTIKARKL